MGGAGSCCVAAMWRWRMHTGTCTGTYIHETHAHTLAALQVHADWACAEKGPGQTTCEALTALAESQAVGLLVVGSIGRKGDKGIEMLVRWGRASGLGSERSVGGVRSRAALLWICQRADNVCGRHLFRQGALRLTVRAARIGACAPSTSRCLAQGHVTDYSLRESHCSVCIVRSTSPPVASGAGQDYLFATDGSKAAMLAFCTLTKQ